MRKGKPFICSVALMGCTTFLFSQDPTSSAYFARAAFGDGSVSTISSCNTSSTPVFRRTVFREAATGNILHDDQGLILGLGCNTSIFEGGAGLQVGFLEQMITGPEDAQVISSVLMKLNIAGTTIDEVRINPEEPALQFTVNFGETSESRNGIAVADTSGNGFSCSVEYRSDLGSLIQGEPVQAGANQGVGLFFDEIVDGLPDGFGWAKFVCDSPVTAMTLGQNTLNGNLSVGRIFLPLASE